MIWINRWIYVFSIHDTPMHLNFGVPYLETHPCQDKHSFEKQPANSMILCNATAIRIHFSSRPSLGSPHDLQSSIACRLALAALAYGERIHAWNRGLLRDMCIYIYIYLFMYEYVYLFLDGYEALCASFRIWSSHNYGHFIEMEGMFTTVLFFSKVSETMVLFMDHTCSCFTSPRKAPL